MRWFVPIRLLLLLGLIGACLGPGPIAGTWHLWIFPVLALLAAVSLAAERRLPARLWLAAAAILGLLAVYALNPSHRWRVGIGLVPVAHLSWLPCSAYSPGSWEVLALAAGLLAAYALALQLTERQRAWLLGLAAAGAAAMACGVLLQRLEPNRWSIYETTGIFVNENHFAVYANLHLPLVLALASRARFRAVQAGRVSSPAGLLWLAALLLAAAVVLSRSRAGVTVMALLVLAHLWRGRRLVRQHPFLDTPLASVFRLLGWVAAAAAAGIVLVVLAREFQRRADVASEIQFRLAILRDVGRTWLDRPAWGTGPGSFTAVFPYYQSELFRGQAVLHAHCEPAQGLAEYGWAGLLWLGGAAGLALSARPRRHSCSPNGGAEIPGFAAWERPALGAGLLALGLHACIDFPLRVPLIALLAAVWAGVWAGSRPAADVPGAVP
jgi:O-antigen ligase